MPATIDGFSFALGVLVGGLVVGGDVGLRGMLGCAGFSFALGRGDAGLLLLRLAVGLS